MNRKRTNKLIHKWLSIPFGIIISILCLTGALLTFQTEILKLSNPDHYYVQNIGDKPIPLEELVPMINEQLEDNTVANVEVYQNPTQTYKMGLKEGFRVSVFVDQYTGKITGRYAVKESYFFQIMRLHRWLLDSTQTWGKSIMGWGTVVFIVILITGLFFFSRKTKQYYTINLRKGTRMTIFGLHNTLGLYAALVLIICSLTGLMWSFEWYRNSVFSVFGAENTAEATDTRKGGRGDGKEEKEKQEINFVTWQIALDNILTPESSYDYAKVSDGLVSAHPNNTYRGRVQDKIVFDKNSGEIKEITLFEKQDVKTRVWAWAYSLHVGDYWGIWSKIFTFIFCLIGASLPFTGYYFTIKTWKNKRKRMNNRS